MLFVPRPAWAGVWMGVASLMCGQSAAAATVSCHTHTVVAGDTLIDLSQRYLAEPGHWQILARANHVRDPRRMPVGTALCIPLDKMKSTPKPGVVLEVVGDAVSEAPEAPPEPAQAQPPNRRQPKPRGKAAGKAAMAQAAPPTPPASTPLHKGDAVPPGMTLRTSTNGYVTVQLADGSILKVQADTEARLESSRHYEEAGFYASIWSVLRGRVESLVTHLTGGQPRYQIKTPQAVLGVRGTEFRVSTDAQRTVGETLSGTVALSSGSHTTLIQAGQGTVTNGQAGVETPQALPSAPTLGGVPTLFERPLMRIDLPEAPGAASYRIQIAEDADFRRVRFEAVSPQAHFRVGDLPDGVYHLRARIANAHGLEGADAVVALRLKARPEPPIPTAPVDHAKVRAKEVTLSWTTHPDARQYRLQVARDAAFTQLVAEHTALKDTQLTLALPVGDYHWRLATTAAAQDMGPWGDPQLLLMREPPPQPPPPVITPDSLQFQLQSEPGQRFEFQMASDAGFTHMLHETASPTPQITLPRPAEGGRLYVRYRAIDDDGFIGPYTSPQMVLLPPCVRSGDMQCVKGGGRFLTSRP